MGAGFVRRYTSFPPLEEILKIEGAVIVDLPPPSSITGIGTGVVNVVGEFADMTFAVKYNNATNLFDTSPQTVECFSAADLILKGGGFDETLGEFGGSFGNGFCMIRNKSFARLLITPVNLTSPQGGRLWRVLPTNVAITNPTPVVPMISASVPAGYMLRSAGGGRVKVAKAVTFLSNDAFVTGTAGSIGINAAVLFFNFTDLTATFVTAGVKEGDVVVIGVIGAAGDNGVIPGTYRVRSVTSETVLVLETQDQVATVTNAALTALVYRIHVAATADTGGEHQLNTTTSEPGSMVVPLRPILNNAGLAADATYPASTPLPPLVAPPSATATTWDPLSGLMGVTNSTPMAYTAAIQRANAPNATVIEQLYLAALNASISEESPARDINLVLCSRLGTNYRTMLKQHVFVASSEGFGRTAQVAPTLNTLSLSTVLGNSGEGVGAVRDERIFYSWPAVRTLIPEALNITIATADGGTTRDGLLDIPFSSYLTALCSNLPPERNPGELSDTTIGVLSSINGYQRGVSGLRMSDYVRLKASGIAAPRNDPDSGFVLQSGITTSLTEGRKNIARIRMSDFIGDSIGRKFNLYAKLPLTEDLKDTIESEATGFLDTLLSTNNPASQRISAYQVDRKSGNIPALEARGVFVVIIRVRTLSTMDNIVLQNEIGEGTVIQTEL